MDGIQGCVVSVRPSDSSSSGVLDCAERPFVPVFVNNRVVYVSEDARDAFSKAVEDIWMDYTLALRVNKKLILDPDMLIELLNHAKYHWHDRLAYFSPDAEVGASEWIENLFINNQNLCAEESRLVRNIISGYKSLVEETVAQNNTAPIVPMWMINSASSRSSRICAIL